MKCKAPGFGLRLSAGEPVPVKRFCDIPLAIQGPIPLGGGVGAWQLGWRKLIGDVETDCDAKKCKLAEAQFPPARIETLDTFGTMGFARALRVRSENEVHPGWSLGILETHDEQRSACTSGLTSSGNGLQRHGCAGFMRQ